MAGFGENERFLDDASYWTNQTQKLPSEVAEARLGVGGIVSENPQFVVAIGF